MQSLQQAMSKSITTFLERRGPRNCDLASNYAPGQRGRPLVFDDARALQSLLAGKAVFSPTMTRRPEVQLGEKRSRIFVIGVDPTTFFMVNPLPLRLRGRPLDREDDLQARRVALVNAEAARELGIADSAGKPLYAKIGHLVFDIVGIEEERRNVAARGAPSDSNAAVLLVPLQTMLRRVLRSDEVFITFRVASGQSIEKVAEEVSQIVRKRHHLLPGDPDDFFILTPGIITKNWEKSQLSTKKFGWLISVSIFLLAAGAAVYVASVSVTERSLELGVKCALGARRAQILGEVALEFVMLGLGGALLGTVAAWVGTQRVRGYALASTVSNEYSADYRALWFMEVDWSSFIGAVFLSLLVCLAGVAMSARRIARLDPVEALRL